MPATPETRFRRRHFLVFGSVITAIAVSAYLPLTLLAPLDATAPTLVSYEPVISVPPTLDWPLGAATAIGAVGFEGVLASNGTTGQRSIASISKVITSLVVLDAHPLTQGDEGPRITFSSRDIEFYNNYLNAGGSTQPVKAGLELTQKQVLHAVLLPSANNYARSLAIWAFGSDAGFVEATRAWLDKKGLESTIILEPTGMNPGNVSTVSDLLEVAKLALANKTISEIVAKPTASLPFLGEFKNSNKLLGHLGIDGIKTGNLEEAGVCLLFSTDRLVGSSVVTIVGVALGGTDRSTQFSQVHDLVAEVGAEFNEVEIVKRGDIFAQYQTQWNDDATAIAATDFTQIIWGDANISATASAKAFTTASDGEPAGTISVVVNGKSTSVPLEVDGELEDPGFWWRLGNPFAPIG